MDQKLEALAQLWLFSAGCDDQAQDTDGINIVKSLTNLLEAVRTNGRREAAATFLKSRPSGEFMRRATGGSRPEDTTDEYDLGILNALLDEVKASGGMQ